MARQTIKKDEESNKKNIENNKIENTQVDENNANNDILNNFVKENEELKLKLSQMAELISQLTSKKTEPKNEDEYTVIQSLCFGELNLSTEGYGSGDIYTFDTFGEELNIPTFDVKKIAKNNKSFAKEGYFYIKSPSIIKSEQLSEDYKRILDFEGIKSLLAETDSNKFAEKFSLLTDGQKKNIVSIMISKVAKDEPIDKNIIYKCGEIYANKGNYILEEATVSKVAFQNRG